MRKFSIYRYTFDEADPDPLFPIEKPVTDDDERRELLLSCFGERGTSFELKSPQKPNDIYPCVVMMNQDGIVMLHIEHPRNVNVWKKENSPDEFPQIDRQTIPSNPYCYVFIDVRKGHNLIAIEINSSAWRNTDTVKILLAVNTNAFFDNQLKGFHVRIDPETYSFDYLEHQRKLIKKDHLKVTRMTIHLKRGGIDPQVEAIVKHNNFIKLLFDSIFKSSRTKISLDNPDVTNLIRKGSKLGEYFMMLIGSEQDDSFGVSLSYNNNRSYEWGDDIRIDFHMNDDILDAALGKFSLFGEQQIGSWFDTLEKDIESERKSTYTPSKRTHESA